MSMQKNKKSLLSKFSKKGKYLQNVKLTDLQKEELEENGFKVGEEEVSATKVKVLNKKVNFVKLPETYTYVIYDGIKVYLLFPHANYFSDRDFGVRYFEHVTKNIVSYLMFMRKTTILQFKNTLQYDSELLGFMFYIGLLYQNYLKLQEDPNLNIHEEFEKVYRPERISTEIYNNELEMFKNTFKFSKENLEPLK